MGVFNAVAGVTLWCLSLPMSYGLVVPAPQTSVTVASGTRPSPVTSTLLAPRTAEAEARCRGGTDDVARSAAGPNLTEFQKFVKQRKSRGSRAILDLRPRADFFREHLVGATSIPVVELEPRLLELPPPFAQPVSIMGSKEDRRAASDFLTEKGWRIDVEIGPDMDTGDLETWPTEVGSHSVQIWRANDFLEFCTERYLLPSALDGSITRGTVLDLGCGSGRDTVYMAQHLPAGTRVVGVDNHSYALERGARLAERWLDATRAGSSNGMNVFCHERDVKVASVKAAASDCAVATRRGEDLRRTCDWLIADLRKAGSLDRLQASVIHGHRFKCEQLLPLLRDEILLPGGYFIWSTFLDTGTENLVPPWRPSRMMRPGELANLFSGEDFEILVDDQGELPTRGSAVPANFFACRKRPDARSYPLQGSWSGGLV